MEMHQVRYFLAMARALNFTRAADECNVTQPSLTRAIQKLEEEFGGPLFRRERSRTHLTDLGRLMQPHLERTYEAAMFAKELALGVGKTQVTPLSLGVASTIGSTALNEVLAEIGANLPGFDLSIVSGASDALIEQALNGTLDLLIVEAPDEAPDRFEAWSLYAHVYHMVTRNDHRLAAGTSVTLADLRDEIWIDGGGDGTKRLSALAEAADFVPNLRHRATNESDLRRLIEAGLGSVFSIASSSGNIVALRIADVDTSRNVVLAAIAGRRRSAAADAFVRASRARNWENV